MIVKIFKAVLWILAIAFFLALLALAEEKTVNSHWISLALKIGGSQTDWQEIPRVSDERLKIDYSFVNGENNLYVLLIFNDPKFLSSIKATRLKI